MGKATRLTQREVGKVLAYKAMNLSKRDIGRRIRRSVTAVSTVLRDGINYGKTKVTGRPKVLSQRTIRQLRKRASNKQVSIFQLKTEFQLNTSLSTIRRTLKDQNLKFTKMHQKPRLTKQHEKMRLNFCLHNMQTSWDSVWFSDEKRWNLDGPDGIAYYWHDLRKEKRFFSKRQGGGQSLNIWAAVSLSGKTSLSIFRQTLNSQRYTIILQNNLLPFFERNQIFQQDNASPHVSRESKQWFAEQNITVMDWPSKSPDLNIIENVWGLMIRDVYNDGRQYNDLDELETAIRVAWENITQEKISRLILTMNKRLFDCIRLQGRIIN